MARWDMMCWFLLSVKSCFAFRSWSVFPSQRQRRRLVIYEPPIDPINNQREIEIIPYSDMLLFAAGNEDIQVETPQYSDEEMKEIMDLAFGEEHVKDLNRKMTAAIEREYDIAEGVNPNRQKSLPIKANIDLWSYTGKQHFTAGNFSGAASYYKRCIEYDPTDGRGWLGMARIHWKKRENDEAEKSYKDGLYYSPNNPYLLQAYAVMLQKLGRVSDASKLLSTSVKYNPQHAASWVELANLHIRKGNTIDARICYENAVEGDKRSYVAYQAWGVLEASLGRPNEARELFKKALSISPTSAYTLQAWAALELNTDNLDEAERILGQAMKAMPSSTRIRLLCAELYERRGDLMNTRQIFSDGASYAVQYGDAGFFQAWGLFEEKYYKIIRRPGISQSNHFDESDDSPTWQHTHHYQLASPYRADNITDADYIARVRDLYRTAIKVNKFHSGSWIAWAKFEERLNNLDVARRLLVSGISQFPNTKNIAWFHCSLGHLAAKQGDINTARACYSRALDTSPKHSSIPIILEYAKFENSNGYVKEARKLYEMGIERFQTKDEVWQAYIEFERRKTPDNTYSQEGQSDQKWSKLPMPLNSLVPMPGDSPDILNLLKRRLQYAKERIDVK